jgi:biotin synthase
MIKKINQITDNILKTKNISFDDAEFLSKISTEDKDFFYFLTSAGRIRQEFRGNKVNLCAIINAKSGNCSEDCKFCAQSVHYNTDVEVYDLVESEKIVEQAKKSEKIKAERLGIVISGEKILKKQEKEKILNAVGKIQKNSKIGVCASLGMLSLEDLKELKQAGLERFHHNIETSKSFFKNICTTHTYEDRVQTVLNAKKAGLGVCSGGIFGLGEDFSHRLEMAFELKELDVDSIPLNFLCPVKGTALENNKPLEPREVLKIIALFRFINPEKEIKICAGREYALRSLESFIFLAGADGMMIGDYLTIKGRNPEDDYVMLKDIGMEI